MGKVNYNTSFPVRLEGDNYWGFAKEGAEAGSLVRVRDLTITSAQLLALNATLQTIVPAPGANFMNIFHGLLLHKPAGVAYAGIAAGEDLSVKYTNTSGLEVARIETTGFLDQTTAQTRHVGRYAAATAINSIVPVENAVFALEMLTGEIITGDSDLLLRVFFSIMPFILIPS